MPGLARNTPCLCSHVLIRRELNYTNSLTGGDEEAEAAALPDQDPEAGQAERREHKRGMVAAVFVPWSHVTSSALNLVRRSGGRNQRSMSACAATVGVS